MSRASLFVAATLLPSALSAQTGTLRGTITDSETRAPVSGAVVIVETTGDLVLSANDGRFLLPGVPVGEHVLRVERIGYRPARHSVTLSAGSTVAVDFALTAEPLSLDALVVTGAAGTRRLREVGSSVERLDIDEVTQRPGTLSDFLQGAAVGMEVTGGSAEAGQGKQIRLRGNGSMVLSNQPLIYIDGIRMMEGAFPSEVFERPDVLLPAGANVTTSSLDLVSVGDIDRVEVVKGPAATTLFGTGSANGVIQIFTKRGVVGPPRWTAEVSQGTGWVRPFGVNGVDYLHVENFLRDAWWGGGYEGGAASGDCVTDDPRWEGANATAEGACSWPGAQWYQRYRLGVAGGSGPVDYFVSGEAQNDSYALPEDELKRYALRASLGARLSERTETRLHASYTDFWTSNTVSGSTVDGVFLSTIRQDTNLLGSADPRDIAALLTNRNEQWVDRFTAGVATTFSQNARASHRLTVGYDLSRQDLQSVHGPQGLFPAAATTRDWERRLWTADYLGSYGFTPAPDLRSTLSFGAQLVSDDLGWTVRSGVGFPDDVPTTPEEADSTQTTMRSGSASTAGLLAQNVLAFRDRWFLTTGLRLDRHASRGQAFFRADPRVGLAWVVSDESFWPQSWGALRLRSAWGRSATPPDPFVQAASYFGGEAPDDAAPGGVLEPETTSEWEAGLDAAVLGGRLTVGFTRYVQTTTNALVPIPVDVGTIPQRIELHNVGELRNRGIELQLDASLVSRRDWGVELGLGIGINHSEVLDLGGADPFRDLDGVLVVGEPVPVSRGRRVADPDAIHEAWSDDLYATDGAGNLALPLGPQLPTRYATPSLSVRLPGGVALAARGEYRGGNVRFVNPVPVARNAASPLCLPWYESPGDVSDRTLKAGTPDLWRERCTPQAASDYWFDGDYFKLRSVAVSVPVGFAFPDAIDQATLTVTLANAWTWHKEVPWWDLEVLGNDGANGDGLGSSDRVPAPTTIQFALRMGF